MELHPERHGYHVTSIPKRLVFCDQKIILSFCLIHKTDKIVNISKCLNFNNCYLEKTYHLFLNSYLETWEMDDATLRF